MNTSKIKAYAPRARRDFIQAVTDKANILGLSAKDILPEEVKGDIAVIGGRPFPKSVEQLRQKIIHRIEVEGFNQVMESVAYTWFNRFMALRYLELHDYLDHGYRVLSNRSGSETPEILEKAAEVNLPGLDKEKVIELRLAGNKDNELYQMLIVAQCNALHRAMPFLFEPINHETELLIPENLLHSSSPIRKMVNEIDEEDWKEVEIIGWIYQFYISERKDELMKAKKPYKADEIPAVTQLFTPNWIVKYLVQNSLGRQWLATYPDSPLREKMEYYIEPAEQEPEVKRQLEEITPKELNPEEITVLDPACGSGHILVEAYNIFKEIYLERGYRLRDIPRIILEKNLYGLDIDDRAAQLAGFALLMKARADDRNILGNGDPPRINVMAIAGSEGIDAERIANALIHDKSRPLVSDSDLFPETKSQKVLTAKEKTEVSKRDIIDLIELFKLGKTLGSLITVPEKTENNLRKIQPLLKEKLESRDLFTQEAAKTLQPFIQQAISLSKKYDCVMTNPPYMGNKYFNKILKQEMISNFKEGKNDLCGCFIIRSLTFTKTFGSISMITIPNWLFISGFEDLRKMVIEKCFIDSLIHIGRGVWGADFGSCSYTLRNYRLKEYKGTFRKLFNKLSIVSNNDLLREKYFRAENYLASTADFQKIPGYKISYWMDKKTINIFDNSNLLFEVAGIKQGLATGDNTRFLRFWYEVASEKIGFNIPNQSEASIFDKKWFPYNKGGGYRKWYGNFEFVVDWADDGYEIRNLFDKDGKILSRPQNREYYFKRSISWSKVTIGQISFRFIPQGFIFDVAGCSIFPNEDLDFYKILGQLNSKVINIFLSDISGSVNYEVGDISNVPFDRDLISSNGKIVFIANEAIEIAKLDWDSFETSWDFRTLPWAGGKLKGKSARESFENWKRYSIEQTRRMKELEEENNRIFIEVYGLQEELTPEVPEEQITLAVNPKYRYGNNYSEEELWQRFREDSVKELISYAIGCMMGRYSLDEPGLVYAYSGNEGFDPSRYKTFPVDADGIIPIMDEEWFSDDAANRFVEFLKAVWSPETIKENLDFVAESLGQKKEESSLETIRRYLNNEFFKDHLRTYKKRPIYWLFSSGKYKAFECLVYLHRYNEATLSRMRSEYVTPLQGKLNARIEYLENEKESAKSASAQKKLQREIDLLRKKQAELSAFDDELRHYADMRINLDLDDGVKVNYAKFGNLLAEVKTVTGDKGD
ncbi:MAG TPA: BREX-1 system adenine-specific DNA-methyltransferase PglX [Thermodesulfobacteriota bacterium]|nr:BREX-1 system adenine-specific DNA-methyltransferase PglX [Thermodesulfobacteriota bacterium]